MSNIETNDKAGMVVVSDEPPLTKSSDSDACIDEIECFPKHYDCRNNSMVSESYSKFEQDLIAIYMKDLQTKQYTADQHIKLVQQQTNMTQEQYDNKLAIAKLMIKQMNHHHHLQEQKYMLEIQTLREMFNLSEQQWNVRMNAVDEELRQQQSNHSQIISELREEIKHCNAQNEKYAAESQKSSSDFDNARLELNGLIVSNQAIVQTLESKIDKQSNDLFASRADATAEKEEMELMVQSWMSQCEVLQQQVQDLHTDLTSTKENIEEASTMHGEIKASIEKMGQTYENVLEHVMEQIQEQTDLQNNNYNEIQATQNKLQQVVEEANKNTSETFIQIEKHAAIQSEKIESLEGQYETVNGAVSCLSNSLLATDGKVTDLKESMNVQSTTQATTQTDVAALQSIVAKLADASNNRFVRMETALENEIKSVKNIKEEIIAASETNHERVKVVDQKIVIHSIQLGEMSKEMKDMNISLLLMKDDHEKAFQSTQMECKEITKLIEITKANQSQVNDDVMKSISSLQTSSKDVELRTTTNEKCIDTITTRMDQFHEDHTKTRGNFMEQHQNMEATVTEQLQVLTQQLSDLQHTAQVDVRNVADTFDKQMQSHQVKIDEYETILLKLNAHTVSTQQKHESSEANIALLQADVRDVKQNIQNMDQTHTLRLNEHIKCANTKLQHIADVAIPDQIESNKKLRDCLSDTERRMKEQVEKSNAEMSDRVDQIQNSITTMNNTIDELSKAQDGAKTDFLEMKQDIEKIATEMSAVNEAFSSEVAHRSELQTKLLEIEVSVQMQSVNANKIESALESYVSDIHEAQEQSKHELNRSLTQVLTLSQMKEAMMNQIADCLVRLAALDTSKAEHSKKIKEIAMNIADHDMKIQSMRERNKTKILETEQVLESYRVALDTLEHDVKKQREVQKGVNEFVSQSVATCSVSISEIDKQKSSELDDISKKLHTHINTSDSKIAKVLSIIDQQGDKQKDIVEKINEAENTIRDYQTRISKDVKTSQALATELKSTIDRHSDRLKTAKDARIVIRNDLKSLVESMNEQLEYVRNQMNEHKENFATYLESTSQTREVLVNSGNDDEILSKIDFLAGRFKVLNENSKLVQDNIASLQDEIDQLRNKTDQEMTSQITEVTGKIDYVTGKVKTANEKAKQTNESIKQIKDEIAKISKNDQNENEKTTELIEEISTKIDYLAGKFKSLNDNAKSTNTAIQSLEKQAAQLSEQQSKDREQFLEKIKENGQIVTLTMKSMEAVTISSASDQDVKYGNLLTEFNDLKVAFEEINAQRHLQNTPKDISTEKRGALAIKIDDMKKGIETIVQKIQTLESEQCAMKLVAAQVDATVPPTSSDVIVDQLKIEVDRLSCQIEQNVDDIEKAKIANQLLATEVHGIFDRQAKYKKAMLKQHGQLKEFVNVTPNMKQIKNRGNLMLNQKNDEEEVYHEARDVEDVIESYSAPVEHRDQE